MKEEKAKKIEKEDKISTGSYDLNKWLYGGYEKGIITTIYGDAGTGKTNFCILVAVSQAKKGNKVIYIDTEGGFSVERVKQICKYFNLDHNYVLKNIVLLKITTFVEQKKSIEKLEKEMRNKNNISLIIVDGMTMLYRLELAEVKDDDSKIREINSELAKQMKILACIARNYNIAVIVTNQAYHEYISERNSIRKAEELKMVGGDILWYWSKCIIELKKENNKRIAILKKHRSLKEKELNFIIFDGGIKKRGFF